MLAGAKVTTLLSGQQPGGGFGVHPYRKWTGAHWRLVSLVELAIPPGEPRAVAAAGHVLAWLASPAGPSRALAGSPAATPPSRETPWPPAAGSAWPPTRGSAPWPDP